VACVDETGTTVPAAGRRRGVVVAAGSVAAAVAAALFARALLGAADGDRARHELAREQAALRRLATRVAVGEPAEAIFLAVALEVGELFGMDGARVVRFLGHDEVFEHVGWHAPGQPPPPSGRVPLEPLSLAAEVQRTGAAVLVEDYASWVQDPAAPRRLGVRSGTAAPIIVNGTLWGVVAGWWRREAKPAAGVERRLAGFTDLVATAVANADSRQEQIRLAEEQAALRRVATLVARESTPAAVFAAVADELGRLLAVGSTIIYRFESERTATVVANRGSLAERLPVGLEVSMEGEHVPGRVLRSGGSARFDDHGNASGELGTAVRESGVRSAFGAPIIVVGRLWGTLVVSTTRPEPLPATMDERVVEFIELVVAAISNVEARAELAESRARLVAAADAERRRVVRDLHDGAQQRLVHTVMTLELARAALAGDGQGRGVELVEEALDQAQRATAEVRELAQGILPAVLTRLGLPAAVDTLTSRAPLPVETDIVVDRLPPAVEATAYFVFAEALTNVAKHSRADRAEVVARVANGLLSLSVRDNGVGGARLDGQGLVGLADRLAALNGRLTVRSPPAGGTVLAAEIPIHGDDRPPPPARWCR
jgi:signal transduction histidine kinase